MSFDFLPFLFIRAIWDARPSLRRSQPRHRRPGCLSLEYQSKAYNQMMALSA